MEEDELRSNFETLWALYPQGDKQEAYNLFEVILSQDKVSFNGYKVNFEFIYDRYKQYVQWWNHRYGKTDKKYLGKNEKSTIHGYLMRADWDKDYTIDLDGKRELYLFGKTPMNILIDLKNQFKKKIYGTEPEQKKTYNKGSTGEPF